MENKPLTFALTGIDELNYYYLNPFELLKENDPDKIVFEIKLNLSYKWNIKDNLFGIDLNVKYRASKMESEEKVAIKAELQHVEVLNLDLRFNYKIDDLDQIFKVVSPKEFYMDERYETTFVSICISTGRGILYEKTKGTVLNSFLLPLVQPSELLLSKKLKKENN